MRKTAVTLLALASLLLALLPATSATAGPSDRRDTVRREAAVLAESMHQYADGGRYPRTMNNRRAQRDLGHEMAAGTRIVKYKRLNRGRDYRLCVVHRKGGWATFSTRTRDLRSSGRGAACRF